MLEVINIAKSRLGPTNQGSGSAIRYTYDREQRDMIADLHLVHGVPIRRIRDELLINEVTLRRWVRARKAPA